MKATELRIGNWAMGNKPFQITAANIAHAALTESQNLDTGWQPIPLTEEWLVKFGFVKIVFNSEKYGYGVEYYLKRKGLFIEIYSDMSLNLYDSDKDLDNEIGVGVQPKHVHQLQNLYFALTGEEINQNKDE